MKKIVTPKVVWVDVDDILVDFHKMFNQHLNTKYNLNLPHDFLPKDMKYSELSINAYKEIDGLPAHWPLNQEVIDGAVEFTHKLNDLGCRVVLITSINGESGHFRIENLLKHKIYFDEIYFTKGIGISKGDLAAKMLHRFHTEDHIFVDDMVKNCIDFANKVPALKTFALDFSYNGPCIKAMSDDDKLKVHYESKTHKELFINVLKLIKGSDND